MLLRKRLCFVEVAAEGRYKSSSFGSLNGSGEFLADGSYAYNCKPDGHLSVSMIALTVCRQVRLAASPPWEKA